MKAVGGNPEVLYLALLSCALTLLPAFVPIGGGLLTALAPFPLIVLAVKYPWRYAMSLIGLEGGLMLLGGQWQSLLYLGQCGLVVLATSGAIRRGWSISQTLVGSLMVSFGVGALLLAMYSTFVQSPIQPLVTRYFDNVVHVSQVTDERLSGPGRRFSGHGEDDSIREFFHRAADRLEALAAVTF